MPDEFEKALEERAAAWAASMESWYMQRGCKTEGKRARHKMEETRDCLQIYRDMRTKSLRKESGIDQAKKEAIK